LEGGEWWVVWVVGGGGGLVWGWLDCICSLECVVYPTA